MDFARQILSVMKMRNDYETLMPGVDLSALDKTTGDMLRRFGTFFEEFPEAKHIDPETFETWLFTMHAPQLKPEERKLVGQVLRAIQPPVEQAVYDGLTGKLRERELASKLADLLMQYKVGKVTGLHHKVQEIGFNFAALTREDVLEDAWAASFAVLLERSDNGFRFQSRLSCINKATGGYPPGAAVLFAGPTDGGKTTAIASESTFWAKQARAAGLGPGIWATNEGEIEKVRLRCYQAGTGMTNHQMITQKDKALAAYRNAVGPYEGKDQPLLVLNTNGWSLFQLERVFRSVNPSFVVADMLANFRGFESSVRDDQRLERLAQWMREKADQYKFFSMATWQLSDEAAASPYPRKECLHGSRIGVQGACDAIITFNRDAEKDAAKEAHVGTFKNARQAEQAQQNLRFTRYMGAPKQKIPGPNGARGFRAEVVADFNRARIEDPQGGDLI